MRNTLHNRSWSLRLVGRERIKRGAMKDADTGVRKVIQQVRKCCEKGCTVALCYGDVHFCPSHKGTCKANGCSNLKVYSSGYCRRHHSRAVNNVAVVPFDKRELKQVEERERAYETVQRLKRKADLRRRHFDAVLAKQGGQCAKSFVTCEVTGDGYATHTCTWGNKRLRPGAADLDHVVPLADGGTDDEANLQVLCKCCHGLKTECETYTRKIRRIREEGKAEREAKERMQGMW